MKTVIIMGVNKSGHKVTEKAHVQPNESVITVATSKLGFVKVSAVMTESAFNKTKE